MICEFTDLHISTMTYNSPFPDFTRKAFNNNGEQRNAKLQKHECVAPSSNPAYQKWQTHMEHETVRSVPHVPYCMSVMLFIWKGLHEKRKQLPRQQTESGHWLQKQHHLQICGSAQQTMRQLHVGRCLFGPTSSDLRTPVITACDV